MKYNKAEILAELIQNLNDELTVIEQASRAAREAATHEESKPEDQYDTRGLEASYLAGAQAQRAAEIQGNIRTLHSLGALKPSEGKAAIGAIITLAMEETNSTYILLPVGGGVRLSNSITVVTPASQLGKELTGRKVGDTFILQLRGQEKEYELLNIF